MDPMQLLLGMASGSGGGGGKTNQQQANQQQSAQKFSSSFDTSLKSSFNTTQNFSHTTRRKISTNEDARGLLRAMMTRELGRRPTASEVDKFQGALNAAQRNNPFVSDSYTTGSEYSTGGSTGWSTGSSMDSSTGSSMDSSRGKSNNTSSNSSSNSNSNSNSKSNSVTNSWGNTSSNSNTDTTETGGVDPQLFAEDYVINNDPNSEYGKYQAATTYANALFAAIRSPV